MIRSLFVLSFVFFWNGVGAQSSGKGSLEYILTNFEKGELSQAYESCKNYLKTRQDDTDAQYLMGKILLEMGQPDKAVSVFSNLIRNERKIQPIWYLGLGEAYHDLSDFEKADKNYRLFIEGTQNSADIRKGRYLIRQAAIGLRYTPGYSTRYVENLGPEINSKSDEFRPVYSPNHEDRIYFTCRKLRDSILYNRGIYSEQLMKRSEMLSGEVKGGLWQSRGMLDPTLMGSEDQEILDFFDEGQKVLFVKEEFGEKRRTYYHSFGTEDYAIPSPWDHPYYKSERGDRDLVRINDSAFIFSSDRYEGYGGYDLFVTYKRLGSWVMENLGSSVNSPYDEVTPFLAADGRTLFFSSNSDRSMGGYDVFYSKFNDRNQTWSDPQNLGRPINSGKDDIGFRLSEMGTEAILSSDRPEGYGGFDIYQMFSSVPLFYQGFYSYPFYQAETFQAFVSSGPFQKEEEEVMKSEVVLSPVYYDKEMVVLSRRTKNELDQIIYYARLYPHIGLTLHVFAGESTQDAFTLFQPFLLLSPIADYLTENGLPNNRMNWRIYSGQSPFEVAGEERSKQPLPVGVLRRLEFEMTNTLNLPVRFVSGKGGNTGNEDIRENYFERWFNKRRGVYFRIKLAETNQLLRGDLLRNESDIMMQISGDKSTYTYYVGLYDTMPSALENLQRLKVNGRHEVEIKAFLKGQMLKKDDLNVDIIEQYPELKEYIIYQQ